MRLKKFNAVVAVVVIAGAASLYGFLSYAWSQGNRLLGNSSAAVSALVRADEGAAGRLGFSAENRQVTEIQWRSYKGDIPGKVSLVKWETGDRIYYQMTGPVNRGTIDSSDGDYFSKGSQGWGHNTEMEVFFDRGNGKYDQWLINPKNAQILHYDGYVKFKSGSKLPKSRYSCQTKGGRIITTFWVHKNDTPGNVVFNYNYGNGAAGNDALGWATTGLSGNDWDHHDMGRWTHP